MHNSPENAPLREEHLPPRALTDRREFLRLAGLSAASLAILRFPAVAGPFTRSDFEKLVPADKKLSPEWVRSLFARGTPEIYRGSDLEKIGMPVGGLFAGQLYLGGDGRLWHWDIFNQHVGTGAEHYANPMKPQSPLDQGFALKISSGGESEVRALDRTGWSDVSFNGEYPLAFVEYRDAASPVTVNLEAFSPFIPLDVDNSSLPATVMRFTVKNTSSHKVEAELAGWLENVVCLHSGAMRDVQRRNRVVRRRGLTALECSAEPPLAESVTAPRPDILFDDFERDAYEPWTATGTAFGKGPVAKNEVIDYQGDLAMHGAHTVNTHAAAPAPDVGGRDAQTGTLISPPFTIERNFITFLIGGGNHTGKTCLNLIVDGKIVRSATGASDNRMKPHSWDVRRWSGKSAQFQAVDNEKGPWGNIGFDHIVFSDQPRAALGSLSDEPDFGTMALALLPGRDGRDFAHALLPDAAVPPGLFAGPADRAATSAMRPFGQKLAGSVARRFVLKPGESNVITFLVTWHFPNLKMDRLPPGRHYGQKYASALAVAEDLATRFDQLRSQTRRWHDTWYDSTLPYWFLDRTFLNTSILASSTSFRLANGRFWGWEGVGCCHGTCGHVWQYAHAMARLFPAIERDTRERVDFGLAQQPDGAIFFRGEFNDIPAIDAQAGTVLRALREHQMTTSAAWLKQNWPGIKRATEWLIAKDANDDGLIEGNQHNTLDTDWFGPVAWLSGMYLAALRAAEVMATEVGDTTFARRCRAILEKGQVNLVTQLYDDGYFINKPDAKHLDAINSGTGSHIDQVFGQSWAFQLGLGRVLPEKETVSALKSLWRYNFTPDVGPYREAYKAGRWYAMPGEGGLLMCSFPRADWDYPQARGKGAEWAAGYFNECMNGFEYQVAGHMLWEGLVLEGLAVTRMVHDRYHPARRNPWNEIECGDHYARSMASYGVYLAACGFEYDGPKRTMAFAPRLAPENFKCAFTAAEGWGSFTQTRNGDTITATLQVNWGKLELLKLALAIPAGTAVQEAQATLGKSRVDIRVVNGLARVEIEFAAGVKLNPERPLTVTLAGL